MRLMLVRERTVNSAVDIVCAYRDDGAKRGAPVARLTARRTQYFGETFADLIECYGAPTRTNSEGLRALAYEMKCCPFVRFIEWQPAPRIDSQTRQRDAWRRRNPQADWTTYQPA